jgi:Flavoprotein
MDTASLRRLIEQTVIQVLREQATGGESPPEPRPLVLMTGCVSGLEPVLQQIRRLNEEMGPVKAALSESFCWLVAPESFSEDTGVTDLHLSLSRAEAENLVMGASLLLIGCLSANSRAKMALGLTDSLPSILWLVARRAGIPIFIAQPPEPLVTPPSPGSNPARQDQAQEQMSILRADGAQLVPATEIFAHVQRFLLERADPVAAKRLREAGPRPIITAEDIERAHRRGLKRWDLPREAIVTMAAHDRARDLGLDLSGGNLP